MILHYFKYGNMPLSCSAVVSHRLSVSFCSQKNFGTAITYASFSLDRLSLNGYSLMGAVVRLRSTEGYGVLGVNLVYSNLTENSKSQVEILESDVSFIRFRHAWHERYTNVKEILSQFDKPYNDLFPDTSKKLDSGKIFYPMRNFLDYMKNLFNDENIYPHSAFYLEELLHIFPINNVWRSGCLMWVYDEAFGEAVCRVYRQSYAGIECFTLLSVTGCSREIFSTIAENFKYKHGTIKSVLHSLYDHIKDQCPGIPGELPEFLKSSPCDGYAAEVKPAESAAKRRRTTGEGAYDTAIVAPPRAAPAPAPAAVGGGGGGGNSSAKAPRPA